MGKCQQTQSRRQLARLSSDNKYDDKAEMCSTRKKRHVSIVVSCIIRKHYSNSARLLLQVSFLGAFVSGASSGACSTVLFQPFDVVKTRLQENAAFGQSTQQRLPYFSCAFVLY